jgi:hypothetical protein
MLATSHAYSTAQLRAENRAFRGTGGLSENNRQRGFLPAFMDRCTGRIYRSCFANGCPAPMHLLDGLPEELVLTRNDRGRVTAIMSTVVAGFLRDERFYSRDQAARLAA